MTVKPTESTGRFLHVDTETADRGVLVVTVKATESTGRFLQWIEVFSL